MKSGIYSGFSAGKKGHGRLSDYFFQQGKLPFETMVYKA